jgi:regulator of replication initiation timing
MKSFSSLYCEIEQKIQDSIHHLEAKHAENQALKIENEHLKIEKKNLRKEIDDLKEKNKFLQLSKSIIKKEDKSEIRKTINDLVREIDNCITLLNKE